VSSDTGKSLASDAPLARNGPANGRCAARRVSVRRSLPLRSLSAYDWPHADRIFPERPCNAMDDHRFDQFTRTFARSGSRRTLLKSLLGLGGVAGAGAALHDAEAARRGYSGPPIPPRATATPTPTALTGCRAICLGECCSGDCTLSGHCCSAGTTVCGNECCPNAQSTCCGGSCCSGVCFDGSCCAQGQTYCSQTGCCDHACVEGGTVCCAPKDTCGDLCCTYTGGYCCEKDDQTRTCTQIGRCCSGLQCPGGRCDSEGFCH